MAGLDFVEIVAKGLKEHCKHWECDHIERLRENKSVQSFYKIFCKITNTYFVDDGSGYCDFREGVNTYDVTFKKKENTATVKRCGKDWDERGADAIIDVEKLIEALVN